jgi:hypothetical protein
MVLEHQKNLIQLTAPLPQHIYRVLGYVHRMDAWLTFLLYQYRSRESEFNDGNYEKDSRDFVVSTHLSLDGVAG